MKLAIKLVLGLSLTLLCLSFSSALAQVSNMAGVNSPTTSNLNAVFIVNNATDNANDLTRLDAWAVGNGGVIVKWDGTSWATMDSTTTDNLYDVFFINSTYGWAVGGDTDRGIILRYNGTWSQWKAISNNGDNASAEDTINQPLYAITMDNTGNVGWAVGGNGTIYGWDGENCFMVPTDTQAPLRSVSIIHNSNNAWAVGDNGTIMSFSNTTNTWTQMMSPTMAPLYAIEMIDQNTGWAGGGSNNNGTVLRLNGGTWSNYTNFNFGGGITTLNATVYSISAGNASSAWAVGSGGTVMYWTGTEWACDANIVDGNLKGVSMIHGISGVNQAWTVGDGGRILAFTGTQWIPEIPAIALPVLLIVVFAVAILGKARLFKKTFFF